MFKSFVIFLLIGRICADDTRKFLCNDGNLIELSQICNGPKDCKDGSDETLQHCLHLICPADTFRCSYGACIPQRYQCDGVTHCADASDENYCNQTTAASCKPDEFRCISGDECIPMKLLCNQLSDCTDKSDENPELCKEFICPNNTYRCRIGGCIRLNQRCNGYKDCIDGSDESDLLCRNLNCFEDHCNDIKCPAITSTTIIAKCTAPASQRNGLLPCNQPLPSGTTVDYKCKPFYVPINEKHSENRQIFCQLDGTWNREVLKCKPDCGRNHVANPLIVHGWISQPINLPWHAVLYLLEDGKWNFICGATLISESVVITAAHCIWEFNEKLLRIGLGKMFSDYYQIEATAQYRDITKIIKHQLYQDYLGNYGSDIAILVLSETVKFSTTVLPACIDWQSNQLTKHNNLGLIAGMGVTEMGNYSQQLRGIHLKLIDYEECLKGQRDDFRKYVTYTTFCAGWTNGSGVCNGDSGGGLMLTTDNRWYLFGIVSVSPSRPNAQLCDPKHYTVFTKIQMYIEWIYKNLNGIIDELV